MWSFLDLQKLFHMIFDAIILFPDYKEQNRKDLFPDIQ